MILAVVGVQLARIDIAQKLLPNSGRVVASIGRRCPIAASAALTSAWADLLRAVISAAILFVTYLILAIISPGGIGMGDVKLAAPLGLYLGYLGWSQLFYGAAFGFVLGGLATFALLRLKPKRITERSGLRAVDAGSRPGRHSVTSVTFAHCCTSCSLAYRALNYK